MDIESVPDTQIYFEARPGQIFRFFTLCRGELTVCFLRRTWVTLMVTTLLNAGFEQQQIHNATENIDPWQALNMLAVRRLTDADVWDNWVVLGAMVSWHLKQRASYCSSIPTLEFWANYPCTQLDCEVLVRGYTHYQGYQAKFDFRSDGLETPALLLDWVPATSGGLWTCWLSIGEQVLKADFFYHQLSANVLKFYVADRLAWPINYPMVRISLDMSHPTYGSQPSIRGTHGF